MANSIDAVDKKLIRELVRDARQPYTILSKKIGVNPVTTKRRVRRLLNEGVVSLEMVPSATKLGYQTAALIGVHVQLPKSQQVADALKANPAIIYMTLTSGRYDILFNAYFKSAAHLADFVSKDLASIDGIEWTETLMVLRRIERQDTGKKDVPNVSRNLDALDKRLILILLDDVRLPFAGLAEKLGISVPTVRQRVGRLVNEGIIFFSGIPDHVKLGLQTATHIGLRVRLSRINDVMKRLETNENISNLWMTAGRYDIIVYSQFNSAADLTTFLQKDMASIDGIERTETFINLGVLKCSYKDILRNI